MSGFPEPPTDDGGAWLRGLPPGKVLVREMDVDRWWELRADGTRVLVGGYPDAMRLAATWRDDSGGIGREPASYTVAKVAPVVLDRWTDATPTKEFR